MNDRHDIVQLSPFFPKPSHCPRQKLSDSLSLPSHSPGSHCSVYGHHEFVCRDVLSKQNPRTAVPPSGLGHSASCCCLHLECRDFIALQGRSVSHFVYALTCSQRVSSLPPVAIVDFELWNAGMPASVESLVWAPWGIYVGEQSLGATVMLPRCADDFHGGWISLHSHQQHLWVSLSPQSHQHFLSFLT